MSKIILATSSPYRQEAFSFLDLDFIAEGSNVDEKFAGRPDDPEELVKYLSKLKAEAVANKYKEGIIIGFDSVGYFKGKILEKPESKEKAFKRLQKLSGNNLQFCTGIHIINLDNNKIISEVVITDISIRKLTEDEITKYLKQDNKYNTYALGFDPLGYYSSTFVRKIRGSYNNFLRGIPLETIVELLKKINYKTI